MAVNENEQSQINEPKGATRRRGEALEEAILYAAWFEFIENGYEKLSMESVATRAKTNKAVLYRRWSNKAELIIAALKKYLPKSTGEIPNTGNLRDDIIIYLTELVKPLRVVGAYTIKSLMTEQMNGRILASLPNVVKTGMEGKLSTAIMLMLKNAELRGEVHVENLSWRVISLPVDLIRYELLMRQEPVSDNVITEIVDDIFLPVLRSKGNPSTDYRR